MDLATNWSPHDLSNRLTNQQPHPRISSKGVCPSFQSYYDARRKAYWICDRVGNYLEINESSLRRHLRACGLAPDTQRGELISQLESAINDCQLDRSVSFAGPLAGHSKGIVELMGQKILVTASPRLIEPVPGEWPMIAKLMKNLFCDPVADQRPYVMGWLKIAVQSLRAGKRRPGQAFAMAGPRECGKSLWQNLTTEMLGGRAAKPYRYMSGRSQFNSDLFGAEHLMIEDECGSTDIRERRKFGTSIKDFTVNEVQSCHAKGRDALSLTPFWRLSISLNDEPENLMILPPVDESLGDKLMLLKVNQGLMPMPTNTQEGRTAFWDALIGELPAFVSSLMNWEIPEGLQCQRFGVTTYHHPDILAAIDGISPEIRLLSLIDLILFAEAGGTPAPIIMTAESIESQLSTSSMGYETRKVLSWSNACGVYLGRLASKRPDRVQRHPNAKRREWCISAP